MDIAKAQLFITNVPSHTEQALLNSTGCASSKKKVHLSPFVKYLLKKSATKLKNCVPVTETT